MTAQARLVRPWETRYAIQDTTVLAEVPDLRILDMALLPGQYVPWHRHPRNADLFIGLEGRFEIRQEPDERIAVGVGQRHEVPVGVAHAVLNAWEAPCRFLVIQGVGLYDYVPVHRPIPVNEATAP